MIGSDAERRGVMRLEFSPESQLDLIEITAFITQDNPARAKSFVDELEADCGRLVTQPSIGAPPPRTGRWGASSAARALAHFLPPR